MFPYIKQIKVNDCYTYQNLLIPPFETESFKHIIITGKNGSGKTTILNRIAVLLGEYRNGFPSIPSRLTLLKAGLKNININKIQLNEQIKNLEGLELFWFSSPLFFTKHEEYIFSFFRANRVVTLNDVTSVTTEDSISKLAKAENFSTQFKQFLVNKKVYEAFDAMKSKNTKHSKEFFTNFTHVLRLIFEDNKLELEFVQEEFEFYLNLSDGRRITFNELSEGFSAFLNILMDLLMKGEFVQKEKKDFTHEPEGIVLIDEPETHLHLEMQYQILPLLARIFPRIQFIIATHSPAIISSLDNSVIYDLSTQKTVSDVQGSSYSELMVQHFGLENEYAPKADELLEKLDLAIKNKDPKKLESLFEEYSKILTPSLRLEIESRIFELRSKMDVND